MIMENHPKGWLLSFKNEEAIKASIHYSIPSRASKLWMPGTVLTSRTVLQGDHIVFLIYQNNDKTLRVLQDDHKIKLEL